MSPIAITFGGRPFATPADRPPATAEKPHQVSPRTTLAFSPMAVPDNGGKAQTVAELTRDAPLRPRTQALFGNVPRNNLLNLTKASDVPKGRDASYRDNDAQAIAGVQGLLYRNVFNRSSIVITDHGHSTEAFATLLAQQDLGVEGFVTERFDPKTEGVAIDANRALDQRQSYGDSIGASLKASKGGGAVFLGMDGHGLMPPKSTLPSAEQVKKVMGPRANIILLTEKASGTSGGPEAYPGPLGDWMREMKAAGIPVRVEGTDSRPKQRLPGLN